MAKSILQTYGKNMRETLAESFQSSVAQYVLPESSIRPVFAKLPLNSFLESHGTIIIASWLFFTAFPREKTSLYNRCLKSFARPFRPFRHFRTGCGVGAGHSRSSEVSALSTYYSFLHSTWFISCWAGCKPAHRMRREGIRLGIERTLRYASTMGFFSHALHARRREPYTWRSMQRKGREREDVVTDKGRVGAASFKSSKWKPIFLAL